MSRRPLAIVYENSRTDDRQFTPHQFVMACVADDLPGVPSFWALAKAIPAFPRNGIPGVLRSIDEADRLLDAFERLLVVLDDDHVREHARLAPDEPPSSVAAKLSERSGRPDAVEVFLLEPNLERLVARAAAALGEPTRPRKKHLTRDKLLMQAARATGTARHVVRSAMPSFDRIVVRVTEIVAPALGRLDL